MERSKSCYRVPKPKLQMWMQMAMPKCLLLHQVPRHHLVTSLRLRPNNNAFSNEYEKDFTVEADGTIVIDEDDDENMVDEDDVQQVAIHDALDAAIKIRNGPWGQVFRNSLLVHGRLAESVFKSVALTVYPDDEWYSAAIRQHTDIFLRVLKTDDVQAGELENLAMSVASSSSASSSDS
jgi:hypothetical protein